MDDAAIFSLCQGLYADILEENEFYQRKPHLAHYTSLAALENILKSEELWFSNPLFMNDLEEVRFGNRIGVAALLGPSSFMCYPVTQSRDRSPGHPMEDAVGSKTDQIKGLANQAAGKLKQGVGKITGSKETQVKGAAQEVKGKAQQTMGKAKSAVKDTANKVADKANKKL